MRLSPWLIVAILALPAVPTVAAAAPLTSAQLNQYEQVGRRFGLTSIQVAEVYGYIDRNAVAISAAAAKERVNQAAFKAFARELGLRNFGADPKALLEAIKANASNAAKFEKDNRELRSRISALESALLRAPAEAILARADAAYAAGDLEKAQNALNSLLELRGGELVGSADAYKAAVETAIALADSRGDLAMIDQIAEQSEPVLARMEKQARRTRWRNQRKRADFRSVRGERFGKMADLDQAVSIYVNSVLPLVPRADYPAEWAATQYFLGLALREQGDLSGGEAGTALLARAVKGLEHALTFYTKGDARAQWALPYINRGPLFEDALTVLRTKAEDSAAWASTQASLGSALIVQGERLVGEAGTALLARAVKAFEDALTVRTKADDPAAWASTQTNLGFALFKQGERSSGEAGTALITRAVKAYEDALTVRTKADAPAQWAATHNDLGNALVAQGERSVGEAGTALLARAVKAYDDALTVRTKADASADWALTQTNLGRALRLQGERSGGEAGTALLARAVLAYEAALTVYGAAYLPEQAQAITDVLVSLKAELARRRGPAK
jgi:tetratricopeptide (TPR) repeat protein